MPPGVNYTIGKKLDIERANEAELGLLPGIGPKKARAIIEYRNLHGSIDGVENLRKVRGIGPKTIHRISVYVTTSQPTACTAIIEGEN
jgi:competence protein ComEA